MRPVHAGEAGCGEGSLLAGRPVHVGEGSPLAVRSVHAGEGAWREESAGDETCPMRGRAGAGRGESAGDETCPCGGGRVWGEGLVNGLYHGLTDGNGLGGAMERGVCWR